MSENQAEYKTEIDDALEMLGAGYEQPAAMIDPPRTITALRDGGLVDYQVWGWVKMSSKFIAHIRNLKGAKLAVWQVVSLSINENGECELPVEKIAGLSGYSSSEVRETLKELDEMGYLSINRRSGRKSIYKPEFAARAGNTPTEEPLQKNDPSRKTTPPVRTHGYPSSPPIENAHSIPLRVKRVNTPKGDLVDFELEKLKAKSIRDAISEYFKLNVKWDTKSAREWIEWAHEENITAEQIARAADTWRFDKQFNWQVPTLKGIFEKWQLLMDASKQPEERKESSGYYA